MIMLVYGREWWNDVTNYGVDDYGGGTNKRFEKMVVLCLGNVK